LSELVQIPKKLSNLKKQTTEEYMATTVSVISGNIAQIPADALITAINSRGAWSGRIDDVIVELAGEQYHDHAWANAPLCDGKTIVAIRQSRHDGQFEDVIFVVDDLRQPLRQIILAGLNVAEEAGYQTVTLPLIRMGAAIGRVEKTPQEAIDEMAAAVRAFLSTGPSSLQSITFVVYNDVQTQLLLTDALGL
jgi:O-acetyl-ADP-ribose deacetylase (regulator of RNase III)